MGHIVGRQVTVTADIALAKCWLDDCVESHEICPKSLNSRLPSRILDLGPPGGASDLRLLVNVESCGRYATLSHCWGNSQPLKLTQTTYDEFQEKIAYESLPKTFQDAVTATRSLGLRYLWIDSLCIIQGSRRDWEEQCTEMGRIYKDSFVTLAGPAASGCDSGFLHHARHTSSQAALQWSEGESFDEVILSHRSINENPYTLGPETDSPLSKRAWVLQERQLSSRVLYFGQKRMYLECFTNVRFEDSHYPIIWEYGEINMVEKSKIDRLGSHFKCFNYWADLVTTYSSMDLTNMTDRLPALSGIASEFQRVTNARYLAGVWLEDMPRALAWHIPFYTNSGVPQLTSASNYIAPSWSWAAAKCGVLFVRDIVDNEFYSHLVIIDAGTTPTGLDPFGMVDGGYIVASGKIQSGLIRELPDLHVAGRRTLYLQSSNSERVAIYDPDDASRVLGSEFRVLLLYLGMYRVGYCVALVIEPVDAHYNTYRRVGLAYTDVLVYRPWVHFTDFFRGTSRSRLRLI
jgi:hypothetical protein